MQREQIERTKIGDGKWMVTKQIRGGVRIPARGSNPRRGGGARTHGMTAAVGAAEAPAATIGAAPNGVRVGLPGL
jgi:hypothetical protein